MRLWLCVLFGLLVCCCHPLQADDKAKATVDAERLFVEQIYPHLRFVQCHLCHNDNGVASETELSFPGNNSSKEQILAFAYQLRDFVDNASPDNSILLLKATGRAEHTGGVRIKPDSVEEQRLKQWIATLSHLSSDEHKKADELIAKAHQWQRQPLSLQRLTHSQYNHTVRDLLGDQSQPANQFPKEDFIRGYKNQLDGQGVSPLLAEAYSQAAERLARSAFRGGDHLGLLPIKPQSAIDSRAAQAFVEDFGLKAFRRPLSTAEVEKYRKLLVKNATNSASDPIDGFLNGATVVVEAMLQSPHFLYRSATNRSATDHSATDHSATDRSVTDRSATDRSVTDGTGSHGKLGSYAVATRLAYVLWDTTPDVELLQAAKTNELLDQRQVEVRIRRMVNDPRADEAFHEFLSQWLRFDRVLSATRDRRRYREFNAEIAGAMVEESQRLFDYLVQGDRDFREFFTADYTFINASLAKLYGLPEPASDFDRVAYPADSGRSGILGHGSFLVSTSKPAETSPTARGIFVRNQLLGQEIAPPPPGVNSVLPEIAEDKPLTNRQRLEVHLNSEACASCHRLIDPIGYAFEQYDAIGAFHEKVQFQFGSREKPINKELEVDTSAFIQGMTNSQFSRPKELGKLLAESETCQRCLVKQYFRYAMGREETNADAPVIDAVVSRFRESGFRFRELVIELVKQTSY